MSFIIEIGDDGVIKITPPAAPSAVQQTLNSINLSIGTIMQQLDDLTREVSEQVTITQSAITLIQGLKAQLDAAGTDPAALAALSAQLDASQQQLAAAITANTPAAPAVP